jgi:UPF0755 protein
MWARHLLSLFVILALGAGAAFYWWQAEIARPGPLEVERNVVMPRGTGVAAMAQRLEAAGIVRDQHLFLAAAWWLGHDRDLKAGEYAVRAQISLQDLVGLLHSGKTVIRRVTVAEGLSSRQIAAILNATEGLEGKVPADLREGELLPETYHFALGDDRAKLVGRMRAAMAETLEKLWRERADGLPFKTPAEAVALASIVEKETGKADERPRVAGVFLNRLKRGMKLQSDPTVIYALAQGGELGRSLSRADLRTASPYNTYAVEGLPPGPIANPGRASLEAVLRPMATEDLYFVADGSGGHAFGKTLDEHNRNVARWRRFMRERGQPEAED